MGKTQLCREKITQNIHMWKIKPFPLERTKRSVIYDFWEYKNKYAREKNTPIFNVETPMRGTKTTKPSPEKKKLHYKILKSTKKHFWKIILVLLTNK